MTAKQKQCLLALLGYYSGEVDGIWGPLSREAESRFREERGGIPEEELEDAFRRAVAEWVPEREDLWSGIRWFTRQEFACRCGRCGGFPVEPDRVLVELAEDVRAHFGAPMRLSSGVRCREHNANVGGVAGSRHLTGKAVDFCIPGKTAAQILAVVRKDARLRYAYAIDGSYVHMDVA